MKKEIVLIAGSNLKEAAGTARWFRDLGMTVYELPSVCDKAALETIRHSLEEEKRLDYLILQATERTINPPALGELNYEEILQTIENSVISSFELVEALLPLLQKGKKRLGLITSAGTSIRNVTETEDFGYAMSEAALHMIWKLYFNRLRPEGFTFRCFCPNPDSSGLSVGEYMHMDFCYDPGEDFAHSDENFLVMRDGNFSEIPW